ncbi:hypothetical protein NE237_032644 [Protea cynaroides]|uniref:Heat shock 70 kDa protein 17 n=1 Tax=Protea cynaroides TaxID=273540 RepID=A0A9Q0R3N7_9MAGN|nr:hypothetical protein NE237_032644 [Protea cynaroides]
MTTWFKFGLVTLILLIISIPSESAVSSIDLGSEWMKVAVVNLKPRQSPISIAINEMSKRKSPALVAFIGGDRLFGEEAAGIIARYPDKVYSNLRDMIRKPLKYVKDFLDSQYLPFDLVEDSRGAAAIRIDDGVTVYSAEELVAMLLSFGRNLAETHSKVPTKDAVITAPPYFGQAERKGLLQAAELAGINVLSLINEHSGAALQYGIDKNFANESRHVIFYDMGSSSTYAALVHFSAYNVKEFGKTVSANQFQVKDVRWDAALGGQHMELRLVEYFADEFNSQVGNGVDVRKSPKAMAKLKKQVKRTKEILSANTIAPISVESLYDDRDFRSTITREKFEELCGDLWEKSLVPVEELLKYSGLKFDEIHAIELIGGATRVPKLQAKLQEFIGRKDLDRHLDADEAIVLGSALHAANLSDGIKLNRKLGMIDGSSYGFMIELDGPDLPTDERTKQTLVQRMKKIPSMMFRSIKHDKDFEVSLSYESSHPLPPGVSSDEFAHYAVTGLTDVSEKYSSHNLSAPIKANLHFSLSRSGILSLDRADSVIEISEWIEVPKRNFTVENASTTTNISLEAGTGNTTEESKDNLVSDGESGNTSSSNLEKKSSVDAITEKKLKKRTFRVPLKVIEKTMGPGMSLSKETLTEAKIRLEALDKKDTERRRTAELKNNLEGYIYATKEKLESSEELEKVSTGQERESFIEKLDEGQEWLYTDGEDASATEFQQRLDMLKAVGDPIFFRLNELSARPEAYELARKYLGGLQQIVSDWEKNKPWLPKAQIDKVLADANEVKNWMEEKEAEQKKNSGFSTPAFTSNEVYQKVFDIQDKVESINKIPKPKPKVEKPQNNEADSEGDQENANTSNSNSEETSTQTDQSAEDPAGSSSEKLDSETEPHDEL